MLTKFSVIFNTNVFSLQEGFNIGKSNGFLIDSKKLKIVFLAVDTSSATKYLAMNDIRNFNGKRILINDSKDLSEKSDLLRYKDIFEQNITLLGMRTETVSGKNLGRVCDFSFDLSSPYIEKVYVRNFIMRSLLKNPLVIGRESIVELTKKKIIVKDNVILLFPKTKVLPAQNS